MAKCRFSVRKARGTKGNVVSVHPVSVEGWRRAVHHAEESSLENGRGEGLVLLSCEEGAVVLIACSDGICQPAKVKTEFMPDVALAGKKKRRR